MLVDALNHRAERDSRTASAMRRNPPKQPARCCPDELTTKTGQSTKARFLRPIAKVSPTPRQGMPRAETSDNAGRFCRAQATGRHSR